MNWVLNILSFTWWLAKHIKKWFAGDDKERRAICIKWLNIIYFSISLTLFVSILIWNWTSNIDLSIELKNIILIFLVLYLFSRGNEIFIAFINDALDKVEKKDSTSNLTYKDRLILAFRSYIELIIDFGIIYYILPLDWWKEKLAPSNIIESIYFSGVTITTLGYGDISPKYWLPQLLTVYQVLCGFVLIVVCFAVYLTNNETQTNKQINRTP